MKYICKCLRFFLGICQDLNVLTNQCTLPMGRFILADKWPTPVLSAKFGNISMSNGKRWQRVLHRFPLLQSYCRLDEFFPEYFYVHVLQFASHLRCFIRDRHANCHIHEYIHLLPGQTDVHKGPVMLKVCPCYGVIMRYIILFRRLSNISAPLFNTFNTRSVLNAWQFTDGVLNGFIFH